MAILSLSKRNAPTGRRARWHPFCLDTTPMVDLAFVLLTFFMISVRPFVLQLTMPAKYNRDITYCGSGRHPGGIVTIILGANHQLHYYAGLNSPLDLSVAVPELRTTNFSSCGIRQLLLTWHSQMPKLVILIKPSPQATYRDMVDILDEMIITDQSRYALTALGAADRQLLRATGRR